MNSACSYPSGNRLVTCSVTAAPPWNATVVVKTIDRFPTTIRRHRLRSSFATPGEAMLEALAWARASYPMTDRFNV
jgi:hypothetical protein